VCELLGGALAAGMTQQEDASGRRRVLNGMLSVLIDPAALTDRAAFEAEARSFIGWAKASPPRHGFPPVMTAGEPERASRAARCAEGVPVDATTWNEILEAARKLGVDPAAVHHAAGLG
jgi:uncharacterized oxidoreductase